MYLYNNITINIDIIETIARFKFEFTVKISIIVHSRTTVHLKSWTGYLLTYRRQRVTAELSEMTL